MTALAVDNIDLYYGAAQALRGVSLKAERGKVTAVLGRNGVGKTSLMRAIMGLQPIARGDILRDGQSIKALAPYDRARRGIVQAAVEGGDRAGLVALAVEELRTRLGESGVFLDAHHRWGRSLGPVSAQFHALNGLRRAADGDDAEVVLAARGISGLQNAGGAWPGVIDTRKGRGAEPYPVFTVNQIALPAIALRGLDEAPLGPAFDWIEGRNPLGFSLIHPTEERIDHGVVPKRRIGSIARGVGRAGTRLRGEPRELGPDDLILDPLVTAEDLGWLLEAWAGRSV